MILNQIYQPLFAIQQPSSILNISSITNTIPDMQIQNYNISNTTNNKSIINKSSKLNPSAPSFTPYTTMQSIAETDHEINDINEIKLNDNNNKDQWCIYDDNDTQKQQQISWFVWTYGDNDTHSNSSHSNSSYSKSIKYDGNIFIMNIFNCSGEEADYNRSWYIWLFIEATIIALLCWITNVIFNVYAWSDKLIIFLWLELFCINIACFGTLFSSFFDNPKIATLLMFGRTFAESLSKSGKNGLCLLGPCCFSLSTSPLEQYESALLGLQCDNIYDCIYGSYSTISCIN